MIFLDEAFAAKKEDAPFKSEYLDKLAEGLKLDDETFASHFGHEAGGMEICYESEVAWNSLMHEMQVAEFKSLQEGVLGTIWEKIKEWAGKIVAFFVKIWKSITAWVSETFHKLMGDRDADLRKKLAGITAKPVKMTMKGDFAKAETASQAVKDLKAAVASAYKTAQSALNDKTLALSDDKNDKFQAACDKVEADYDKVIAKLDEKMEKEHEVSIKPSDVMNELTGFDKRIKGLVDVLNDQKSLIETGTKAAEAAKARAEKASAKKQDKLDKAAEKDKDLDKPSAELKEAQKDVRNKVAIANFCRKLVNNAITIAQKSKAQIMYSHSVARSAAKKMIAEAK